MHCVHTSNIFGCVGVKEGQYCICDRGRDDFGRCHYPRRPPRITSRSSSTSSCRPAQHLRGPTTAGSGSVMTDRPRSVDVVTLPYPGFPTDLQPPWIALAAVSDGAAMVTENVYDSRFSFIHELVRLGAEIRTDGHHAVIRGRDSLSGAPVRSTGHPGRRRAGDRRPRRRWCDDDERHHHHIDGGCGISPPRAGDFRRRTSSASRTSTCSAAISRTTRRNSRKPDISPAGVSAPHRLATAPGYTVLGRVERGGGGKGKGKQKGRGWCCWEGGGSAQLSPPGGRSMLQSMMDRGI